MAVAKRSEDEVEAAVVEDFAAITFLILTHCGLHFSIKHK